MQINRCIGCMCELESYPCHRCGFDARSYTHPEYALPCNTVLHGRYLIGKVLGQGGFGITYVGWDLVLEERIAIKEYFPSGQVTRNGTSTVLNWYETAQAEDLRINGLDSFLKESRKMARVRHIPEIVPVHNTFPENGTAYIVMDFVDGETLKSKLERDGVLSWKEAQTIFKSAISAMERVHQEGLVHRDLSPDNLMLLPDGTVKILDLGAAKDLSISTGASSMQVAKNGFSPLEQYTQRGGSGPWSDVYSIAASLYYALTGVLPPSAIDRLEDDAIRWDLPQLRALPGHVLEAMKGALTVLAKERTQTMGTLLEQMGCASSKKRKQNAHGKNPVGRVRRWITGMVAAIVLISVALILLPKGASSPEENASLEAATEPAPTADSETVPPTTAPPVSALVSSDPVYSSLAAGQTHSVGLKEDGTVVAAGSNIDQQCNVSDWENIISVAAGPNMTAGLTSSGTVIAAGSNQYGQCDTESWSEIKSVYILDFMNCTIGLKSDGTLAVAGQTESTIGPTQIPVTLNLLDWTDIVDISSNFGFVLGLKSNGTVVATGLNDHGQCNVNEWNDIIEIKAGSNHAVGLKSDGTVVATGLNSFGQCDLEDWKDIDEIEAGNQCTVGLKKDGTVVFAGWDNDGKFNVSTWTDVVSLSSCGATITGLRSDGTVLATGENNLGQCNVSKWKSIVAVSTNEEYTLGLKSDGTVVATGSNGFQQCRVNGWKNVRLPPDPVAAELKAIFGNTMDISNTSSYYFPGKMQGNPNSVGAMQVTSKIKGPTEVCDVYLGSWFTSPPSQATINSSIAMMIDVWKDDGQRVRQNHLPFRVQIRHPVDSSELGKTLYVLLIGLDKNGDFAGYAMIREDVPPPDPI